MCPVLGAVLLGGEAEFHEIDDAFLFYFLGSVGVEGRVSAATAVAGIVSLGWAFSQRNGTATLLEPVSGERTNLDSSGFGVGAAVRLGFAATRTVSPILHAAWRMVLMDTDEYEGGDVVRRSSEPVSSFTLTFGVRLRL